MLRIQYSIDYPVPIGKLHGLLAHRVSMDGAIKPGGKWCFIGLLWPWLAALACHQVF